MASLHLIIMFHVSTRVLVQPMDSGWGQGPGFNQ